MSEEKQIKEMIEIVKPFVSGLACGDESGACELTDCRSCKAMNLVNQLRDADYRKQEWISVDERLPKKYGDVLCHTRKGAIWQVTYNPKYRLFNVSYDNVENAMDVDYWMPLPEAPKMKGAEK